MRYPPITPSDWTSEQRDVARAIVEGPRGEVRGPFVPLLHAPALAAKIQDLGAVIRFKTSIPQPLLEIVVLVTARHHDCPNIWESHSKLAAKAGVAPSIIAAIAERKRPDGMPHDEDLVHDYAAALLSQHKVGDGLFDAVVARWGKKGAMELAAISGYYGLLATVLNVAERPLVSTASVPFGS
jgi:4-carboxymuconolactone decarboxylase